MNQRLANLQTTTDPISANAKDIGKSGCHRAEDLQDKDVVEWLKGDRAPDRKKLGKREGHIRLLICHQREEDVKREVMNSKGHPVSVTEKGPCFYMSRESFEAAEEHLRLPDNTLPDLTNIWGIQTSQIVETKDSQGRRLFSLDITMKSATIPELADAGLSMSHSFTDRTTTAFVRGFNAVERDTNYDLPHTLASRFASMLKHSLPLWKHPLLLPAILLHHELAGIRDYSRDKLRIGTQGIRQTLNTQEYEDLAEILGGYNSDEAARRKRSEFTTEVNNLLCGAISIRRALQVARRSANFLLGVLDEISDSTFNDKVFGPGQADEKADQEVKDWIRALDNGAAGFEVGIDAIISTLGVQLDILSTVAAQLDSNRSAEMGAQAGMDSVAMKTLALVTAVFLPATFIATLFSMSVFDFRADPSTADGSVVSNNFWIFWAVSAPLTIIVLGLWWIWWDVSRSFYAFKFKDANGERGTQLDAFKRWAKDLKKTIGRSGAATPPAAGLVV